MTCSPLRALALCFCGFVILGLRATTANADITWTIQPTSRIGAVAKVYLPAFDIFDPENPDPNSDTYVPPIVITSIPQTDPGTSGDPALGANALNSLMSVGVTGVFTTKGNTPTTSLNFGNPFNPSLSNLTVVADTGGNFLPSTIPPPNLGSATVPTFDVNGQPHFNFGTAGPVNNANSLITQSPLTGYNALAGNDFSQASRDNGRVAIYGLKGLPVSSADMPVTAGTFDASQLAFRGALGLAVNIALAADPNSILGFAPASLNLLPGDLGIGRHANLLTGAAAKGTITRSGGAAPNTGPDYIMTAPYSTIYVITENFDGSNQLSVTVNFNIVAKAGILPGDVNFDGLVDATDRSIVLSHLGQTSPDHLGVGDANGDGIVNATDLQLVPEPSTLVGLAIGIAVLGAWRLRRG